MAFDSIERAIDQIRAGRLVIVADDEDRENEGDLVCAASAITPEMVNFMATHGRGLICVALEGDRADALSLPPMAEQNSSASRTSVVKIAEARPCGTPLLIAIASVSES